MAFGGGTKPVHMLPKPTIAKTARSLGGLSVPKPKAGVPRPTPSSTCCGKRA
jgi:hypothetical protein